MKVLINKTKNVMLPLTLHKVCVFSLSFPQSLGGNPFFRKHGCTTENLGHDGKRTMTWRQHAVNSDIKSVSRFKNPSSNHGKPEVMEKMIRAGIVAGCKCI